MERRLKMDHSSVVDYRALAGRLRAMIPVFIDGCGRQDDLRTAAALDVALSAARRAVAGEGAAQ